MKMMDSLTQQVLATATTEQLWNDGDTIVVAVSGGVDSIALLHILYEISLTTPLKLVVAHVNHGFRPVESAHEQSYVERVANTLQLPYEYVQLNMPAIIERDQGNAQDLARQYRYQFLFEVATKYNATHVALGHHADDQAETIVMRLIRGTGSAGLTGIAMKRLQKNVQLIRPLLRIKKREIISYCERHHINHCEDSSNQFRTYERNKIRLDVLPVLQQYNPLVVDALNRLSQIVHDEHEWMESETQKLYQQLVSEKDGVLSFEFHHMSFIHVALQRRLIKLILDYVFGVYNFTNFEQIEAVRNGALNEAKSHWKIELGHGCIAIRDGNYMLFYPTVQASQRTVDSALSFCYELQRATTQLSIAEANVVIECEMITNGHLDHSNKYEAYFDVEQLTFPLYFRNRQAGDRVQLPGMNGSKKVQDLFVDDKVPRQIRNCIPILVDAQGQILWIAGLRRSSAALVSSTTQHILRLNARTLPY